jgi:hypothetical protein
MSTYEPTFHSMSRKDQIKYLKICLLDDPMLMEFAMPLLEKAGSSLWNWVTDLITTPSTKPQSQNFSPASFPSYKRNVAATLGNPNPINSIYRSNVTEVQKADAYDYDSVNLNYVDCFICPEDYVDRRPQV